MFKNTFFLRNSFDDVNKMYQLVGMEYVCLMLSYMGFAGYWMAEQDWSCQVQESSTLVC